MVTVLGPVTDGTGAVLRTAIAELGVLREGRCLLERAETDGLHGDHDRVRAGRQGILDKPLAIIVRIGAVGVDADQVVAAGAEFGDGTIDRRALYALRIVEEEHPWILSGKAPGDLPCSVRAAAVGNDDPRVQRCE